MARFHSAVRPGSLSHCHELLGHLNGTLQLLLLWLTPVCVSYWPALSEITSLDKHEKLIRWSVSVFGLLGCGYFIIQKHVKLVLTAKPQKTTKFCSLCLKHNLSQFAKLCVVTISFNINIHPEWLDHRWTALSTGVSTHQTRTEDTFDKSDRSAHIQRWSRPFAATFLLALHADMCPGPHCRAAYSTDVLCETKKKKKKKKKKNRQNKLRTVWFPFGSLECILPFFMHS